eukprot:CAMPEP_0174371748 /NCGR_PEP_ID=MMETSP0811_2-20130205/100956_1 /TAXON_ID=73025 ORGANISM="Eutreptiella gymnastica-like, Strain CCMP1594" /NCGR_SAMPLE_ID=MMETSP0811_2 /ASSEMBLY_ACC=CAM_ASM_000667 /LENGTH=162 /DNA_ID=CAMNT_0015518443 /DNA_START=49 /DNA_END=538 /DNA_ORIENTATION=+
MHNVIGPTMDQVFELAYHPMAVDSNLLDGHNLTCAFFQATVNSPIMSTADTFADLKDAKGAGEAVLEGRGPGRHSCGGLPFSDGKGLNAESSRVLLGTAQPSKVSSAQASTRGTDEGGYDTFSGRLSEAWLVRRIMLMLDWRLTGLESGRGSSTNLARGLTP